MMQKKQEEWKICVWIVLPLKAINKGKVKHSPSKKVKRIELSSWFSSTNDLSRELHYSDFSK